MKLVMITAPERSATEIARALVEERLAACVNVLPGATSVYRWRGRIEEESEHILLCKTRGDLLEDLKRRVCDLHPYEVPEVIALGIESGLEAYLDWIGEETRQP